MALDLWIGVAVLLAAAWAVQQLFYTIRFPSNLPRIGGGSRFSLRTRWRYHTDARGLYKEAYDNVSVVLKKILQLMTPYHRLITHNGHLVLEEGSDRAGSWARVPRRCNPTS